jgi:hypothetical protein
MVGTSLGQHNQFIRMKRLSKRHGKILIVGTGMRLICFRAMIYSCVASLYIAIIFHMIIPYFLSVNLEC